MIVILSVHLGFSQGTEELLNEESDRGLVGGINDLWLYNTVRSGNEEITGNPFLYENWNNAGVVYSEGVAHSISKLNYNMYSDEVAELKSANEVFVFDKAAIDSLVISGRHFKKLNGSFYEVISKGDKLSLLKQHSTRVQKGQFNPTDGTTTPSRLVRMDDYFTYQSGKIDKFKASKGSVMDLFADKQGDVKKLIKDEKLSFKKDEDLKRMFDFYNNL
jgi:hypothetical protein